MKKKKLKLENPSKDRCIVSAKILRDGWKVGYMYREDPIPNKPDSGWRFLKGDENSEFMNGEYNSQIVSLKELANIDPAIIPYLSSKVGSSYIRIEKNKFELDKGTRDMVMEQQNKLDKKQVKLKNYLQKRKKNKNKYDSIKK